MKVSKRFNNLQQVTLGRNAKSHIVDIDLSLEGPSKKISRRQGTIRLRNHGDFSISNEGKRPIFVDGRPVLSGNKHKLINNSVVEVKKIVWNKVAVWRLFIRVFFVF